MPTTLPTAAGSRLPSSGEARDLALDGSEQVVDVVAFEQPLAQRVEGGALLRHRRMLLAVPPRAQLLQLPLVLVALDIDRRARLLEPSAQPVRIRSRFTELANLVELLVEREDFLEQRRRYCRSRLPRACRGVFRFRGWQAFNREE